MNRTLLILLLACALVNTVFVRASCGGNEATPGVSNCTEFYFTNLVDHFVWRNETYQQRYFVCDKYHKPGGPIFFYTGNEGNVEMYTNCTGLMWENAENFSALLVFAEHRFFGKSLPCPGGFRECGDSLSPDQALADYAALLISLRRQYQPSAVIAFGGSYGGMLTAWMRMRYPALVDGGIAASAPLQCLSPTYVKESYWAAVTQGATAFGGAPEHCASRISAAFSKVRRRTQSRKGRAELTRMFHLCDPLEEKNTTQLLLYLQAAFDTLAMGNYPFPTSYICGSAEQPCPAWPLRVACGKFENYTSITRAMYEAVSIAFNTTGNVMCYNISGESGATYSFIWDYMVCTSGIINEQPYFPAAGWPQDMFWPQEQWNASRVSAHCMAAFGKRPREGYLDATLGVENLRAASNLVFSNGLLDPWHTGGVLHDVSASVVAVVIPEGAHHLDLFFTNAADPPALKKARAVEMAHVRRWIDEAMRKHHHHGRVRLR